MMMTEVTVTPEDREAYLAFNRLTEDYAGIVRSGIWDNTTGLQIIARHRLTSIAKAAEERDALAAALEKIESAPAWGYPDKWETTPAEVRQLARAALAKLGDVEGQAPAAGPWLRVGTFTPELDKYYLAQGAFRTSVKLGKHIDDDNAFAAVIHFQEQQT